MRMIIPDIGHAKTGYPGSAWPSAYAVGAEAWDGAWGVGCCAGGGV